MKYLLFIFVVLLMLITCCITKEELNSSKYDKEITSITSIELLDKLNKNEQATINDKINHRIQITGVITDMSRPGGPFPIVYDESGNQIFDIEKIPLPSYIFFGYEEWGWQMFFHFKYNEIDKIADKDIHNGDIITIEGILESVERNLVIIPESMHVPITESEIQYRNVMYVDIKDCVIIEVKGIQE